MGKWIFEDIQTIKDECLYNKTKTLKECIKDYNKRLREEIEPEIYVKYMLWQCDIYVDVYSIIVASKIIYPQLKDEQIVKWLNDNKEAHHQYI